MGCETFHIESAGSGYFEMALAVESALVCASGRVAERVGAAVADYQFYAFAVAYVDGRAGGRCKRKSVESYRRLIATVEGERAFGRSSRQAVGDFASIGCRERAALCGGDCRSVTCERNEAHDVTGNGDGGGLAVVGHSYGVVGGNAAVDIHVGDFTHRQGAAHHCQQRVARIGHVARLRCGDYICHVSADYVEALGHCRSADEADGQYCERTFHFTIILRVSEPWFTR